MTKLTIAEIHDIALSVFARVFSGSPIAEAPINVVSDSEWGDPNFVRIEIVHQQEPVGFNAQRRAEAAVAIQEAAWALGDERFFGVSGNYELMSRSAA